MFFSGQFQHGYVTRNLEAAVERVGGQLGISQFDFDAVDIPVRTPAGNGNARFRVALGWADQRHIELIEPQSGLVSLYADWLPADDSLRFHHLGMRCADLEQVRRDAASRGWQVAVEGSVPGIDFLYVDATPTLGHYLEFICGTAEAWQGMRWPQGLAFS